MLDFRCLIVGCGAWRTSARVGDLAKRSRKKKGAGEGEETKRQAYEIYMPFLCPSLFLNSKNILLESDLCQCFTATLFLIMRPKLYRIPTGNSALFISELESCNLFIIL